MTFRQILIFLSVLTIVSCRGLREEFTWTRITYQWPGGGGDAIAFPGSTYAAGAVRRPMKSYGHQPTPKPGDPSASYIYQNNIPMGANVWNQKLFVTVPRRRVGVPSTLNYVWVNGSQHHNAPLIPYPDWESNTLGGRGINGQKIVSVYRVAVDPCDRLWFVDTGTIETPGNPDHVQPTALVIMDLKTDRIIRRHPIDASFLGPATNLASVTVDVTADQCDNAYAYMPDLGGFALIVYSLKSDSAWRIGHNYFHLEPTAGDFSIGGQQFQWSDGIFSLAISDLKSDGYRDAYFHSMAGFNEYRVSTRILRNETLATRSYHGDDFQVIGNKGQLSQTSASDLAKRRGILFLGLVNQNALACWNTATPITDISIIQKDDQKMIYPCDVKISGENVILLTNTMPVFLYGQLNYDQTNFRVWVETIDTAVKGTKCDKPPPPKN